MNFSDTPPELRSRFEEINKQFLNKSRDQLNKDTEKHSKILEDLNAKTFDLQKDILVLVGSIFGSSIALVTGREPGNLFILGETFLLFSICSGLVILVSHLRSREWSYAFFSKMSIESYLLLHEKNIESFENTNLKEFLMDYEKIMQKNKSGFMYDLLKIVPIECWPKLANLSFLIGIVFILLSIF